MTPGEVGKKVLAIEDDLAAIRQDLLRHDEEYPVLGMSAWPKGFSSNMATLLGYVERDVNAAKLAVEEGKREQIAAEMGRR